MRIDDNEVGYRKMGLRCVVPLHVSGLCSAQPIWPLRWRYKVNAHMLREYAGKPISALRGAAGSPRSKVGS
jgi:hypothetical protein